MVRAALRCTAASMILGVAMAAGPVLAKPEHDSDNAEDRAGTIIVTGSHVARSDLNVSTPSVVLPRDWIARTGAANVQDVLADLPFVGQGISRTTSNFSTTGNGRASVNLRNLGSSRTLVLVNGRRFVAGVPGTSIVDLNTIPTDLIKEVQVVTGGASSVYGSEAIAGAVNFIFDDAFEGLRLHAQNGISGKGDAGRYQASLTGGSSFFDSRGHVVVNVSYDRDKGLRSRNRGFSRQDQPSLSSFNAQGLFSPNGSFAPGNGTFTFDHDNILKNYQSANIDGYNRNYDRYLAVPVRRFLVAGLGKYEIADDFELFGEVEYAATKSRSSLEPLAVAYTDLRNPDGSAYAGIPITNPFIPQAIRDAMISRGVASLPFRRRSNDIFDRSNRSDRETWRIVGGVRGALADAFEWELHYIEGETRDRTSAGTLFGPHYVNALNAVAGPDGPVCAINADADPANDDPACVPINIFGFNTVSAEAARYVTDGGRRSTYDARVRQKVFSASLSGKAFTLPGGPLRFVAGGEYRRESSSEDFDQATNDGLTLGNLQSDTHGQYKVGEGYFEVVAPLLSGRPFFHSLGVEGAVRYADYSTVGGVWSWKAGGYWAPTQDLRFRGVYAEATRAPGIGELYSARNEIFPAIVDPCDQASGAGDAWNGVLAPLSAACVANPAIAAAAANGGFVYTTAQIQAINGFTGGNPRLQEETAKTLTLGAVFTPRTVPGLNISVDYYRIRVENAIGIIGQQTSLDECYRGGGLEIFCNNILRDAGGHVTQVDAFNLNTGSYLVSGIDTAVHYSLNIGKSVNLDIRGYWTHLLEQQKVSFPGGPGQPEVGQLDCFSCGRLGTGFRDKASISVAASTDDVSLNWRVTYLASVRDTLASPAAIRTGDFWYHDAQMRFNLPAREAFSLYMGIDNIFDKKPPLFSDTNVVTFRGTQTVASTYDVYGRMFYAGAEFRF